MMISVLVAAETRKGGEEDQADDDDKDTGSDDVDDENVDSGDDYDGDIRDGGAMMVVVATMVGDPSW